MKQRKSDILWKVVMEEVFDDLLRFLFPDADQVYNMERGFEFLEKELAEMYPEPAKETNTRFADKLVKVFNRKGQEEWMLCHIEIQGKTKKGDRPIFADRMFRYFYRIWDRYQKPVTAVAIFTGVDGMAMPDHFKYEYRKTRLLYEYDTISIVDFTDEELEKSDNPFATVVLAARTSLLEERIPEGELERIQSHDKNNIMGIDEYLKMVGREEGLEKGLKQGRVEEAEKRNRLFVENLLSKTEFSVEKIASLADVTVNFVKKVKAGMKSK